MDISLPFNPEVTQISSIILVISMKRKKYNPELHTYIYVILV